MANPFRFLEQAAFLPPGGGLFGSPSAAHMGVEQRREEFEAEQRMASEHERSAAQLVQYAGELAGRGMPPHQILATLMSSPQGAALYGSADAEFQELMPKVIEAATVPPPKPASYGPGTSFGTTDPLTGAYTEQGRTPYAPVAPQVVVTNMAERELSIQKARADAQRVFTDLPTLRRDLRGQMTQANVMEQLLASGTETGKWPDAAKRYVRDRFGIDVGLDPSLETFSTLAGQEMLSLGEGLKGATSDRDREVLQSLVANAGRGRAANLAILKARKEVLARLDKEASLEERYFEKMETRAGFEEWLRDQNLGPVLSQDAVKAITTPVIEAERQHGAQAGSLADAVAAGDVATAGRLVQEMSADQLKRLPTATLEALNRLLGGE